MRDEMPPLKPIPDDEDILQAFGVLLVTAQARGATHVKIPLREALELGEVIHARAKEYARLSAGAGAVGGTSSEKRGPQIVALEAAVGVEHERSAYSREDAAVVSSVTPTAPSAPAAQPAAETDAKDAARYRRLRNRPQMKGKYPRGVQVIEWESQSGGNNLRGDELDAAVDALPTTPVQPKEPT